MSALSEVQQKWAINTESKEVTGILLWDLSAALLLFKCHLNTRQPDHLNTGQMDALSFSYVLVPYSNGWSSTKDIIHTPTI